MVKFHLHDIPIGIPDWVYSVRDFLFPHNVIKLPSLSKKWQETDVLMETAVFQLLVNFFNQQQPFHLASGTPYEDDEMLTIARHRELLDLVEYDAEDHEVWSKLLDIAEWFIVFTTQPVDAKDVFIAVFRTTGNFEDAIQAEKDYEERMTEMLCYAIKHRGRLWT